MSAPTRREFLVLVAAAHQHARHMVDSGRPARWQFFTPEQAAEVEAVAACIIPTDSSPGAREAGVIYFIDRALATFDRDKRRLYERGVRDLRKRKFSKLDPARQIETLRKMEKSEFFELVRFHTIAGFFGSPEHGGNRDLAGWKLLGFEDRATFEPPFGYYDRT